MAILHVNMLSEAIQRMFGHVLLFTHSHMCVSRPIQAESEQKLECQTEACKLLNVIMELSNCSLFFSIVLDPLYKSPENLIP